MTNPSDEEVTRSYAVDRKNSEFIEQRHQRRSVPEANAASAYWRSSEQEWHQDLERQRSEAWRLHWQQRARLHQALADEARAKAEALGGEEKA
jgi:hypothetical protein